MGILLSLICSLRSLQGRVFDFAVTDVVFLVVLIIWLSFCADPQLLHVPVTGTVAVDAPLAGCKRTVWASLGPTHRYFIDVWQQGQWANAPAGDWSCLSPEKEESGSGLSLTRQSRVGFHSLTWKGEAIPRCRFVMNFSCLFNALCVIGFACWRWILAWSVCFIATSLSSVFSVVRCSARKFSHGFLSLRREACFYARASSR